MMQFSFRETDATLNVCQGLGWKTACSPTIRTKLITTAREYCGELESSRRVDLPQKPERRVIAPFIQDQLIWIKPEMELANRVLPAVHGNPVLALAEITPFLG